MKLFLSALLGVLLTTFSFAQNFPEFVIDNAGYGYFNSKNGIWRIDASGKKEQILNNTSTRFLAIDQKGYLIGSQDSVSKLTGKTEIYIWRLLRDGHVQYINKILILPTQTDLYMDAEEHLYCIEKGISTLFQINLTRDRFSTLASGNYTNARNLHVSTKRFLFFSDSNQVYCIPPDDSVKPVINLSVKLFHGEDEKPVIRNLWTDKGGNIYVAYGNEVIKIDRRQYTTPVYRSANDWFPVNGAVSASGDFWVVEQNHADRIRVQVISSNERKLIANEQRLKLYGLPTLFVVLVVLILYFLFRKSGKSGSGTKQ